MLVSVIIAHLNQERQLQRCLESLHAQVGNCAQVEIIVVDNGSHSLPEKACSEWPDVALRSEAKPGPGPARNRGVAEAKGDILAFIDADCYADPSWLAAIETAFRDPSTKIVGGDVQVTYLDPANPSFLEPYEAIYSYRNHLHIAEGYSVTCNLATLPTVVADVGPFAGIEVAEDRDWGLRAKAHGYPTRYLEDMIVFHPARDTFGQLAKKWDRHTAHDFEEFTQSRFGRLKWVARTIAVAGSPLFELYTLASSKRVKNSKERWLALLCLTRIRWYRAKRMATLSLNGENRKISSNWNRD
jgi:glycosyltransferase involved in cell wall biosynthesis